MKSGFVVPVGQRGNASPRDIENFQADPALPWDGEGDDGGRIEGVRIVLQQLEPVRRVAAVFSAAGFIAPGTGILDWFGGAPEAEVVEGDPVAVIGGQLCGVAVEADAHPEVRVVTGGFNLAEIDLV